MNIRFTQETHAVLRVLADKRGCSIPALAASIVTNDPTIQEEINNVRASSRSTDRETQ